MFAACRWSRGKSRPSQMNRGSRNRGLLALPERNDVVRLRVGRVTGCAPLVLRKAACDTAHYEAAGADLLVARRSSIRSRSTSQYLSAESRSLSCSSQQRDSSGSSVFGPESFAARCSLRLDFALRHLPRRRLAAPVTIVPSFVLSVL